MDTIKICVLTEGGKNIGFGHITRCVALYEAFKERNIEPTLIIKGDKNIVDLLKGKNYKIFNWLKEQNKLFKMLTEADIVIIDSYLANKDLYNRISGIINEKSLVMIDDYRRIKYPHGIVVNPSIYGDKLNYSQRDSSDYLLGKDYIILRKEFRETSVNKIIKKRVKDILIMSGGINHSDLMHKIINYLKNKFNFNFHIVEPNKNRFNAKEILNLMLKADICISGGGQTTYELARIGIPTIGICFAENQRLNLEEWQKRGFIEYVGWYKNKGLLNRIENSINKFMPYKKRARFSRIGRNLVDGKGVGRIINKLIKI
ncbi:MAG: UDP-2,4-diacetamido-2,4,6-trideoxy-beta-L-altropyranose hydrolase [Candidatus Omnitrophica bacterium]|nr:UDP-2,4-diacetamido-2,4,6-trideoxy-beta-L-altropyranose hydrolase [Candidatus Omnitrophota bacterium]MDD5352393.1 UDP-2,4-diacetamido-2,4,6-trideoxy-beta-L-altropyranose hydrolase [Candidatus Omnitrophota bacterium]MDD5549991.1 UDP-2,4-diacetamido-2,4,6-trideoxy-beta-L-altropyranose hydrolase [Candidatus Omnitrophota bacterium]